MLTVSTEKRWNSINAPVAQLDRAVFLVLVYTAPCPHIGLLNRSLTWDGRYEVRFLHGVPLGDFMDRILKSVIEDANGCWVWQRSVNSAGYGQITVNKKYWLTHRYVYHTVNGPIPDGTVIRHLCHNTRCCNPQHLTSGSHQDNWNDSEEVHKAAHISKSLCWKINDQTFLGIRQASKATGIHQNTLIKYTDPVTRIFNTDAYRDACAVAGWKPKVW